MKRKGKLVSVILTVICLLMNLLPVAAFAEGTPVLYVNNGYTGTSNGAYNMPYKTLDAAYAAAPASSASTIMVQSSMTLAAPVVLGTAGKAVTIQTADKNISGSAISGKVTISRASGATSDSMLKITAGTVTLQNIVLDGGAVWNSDLSSSAAQVLGHGKINNGLTASAPAIFLCPAAYIGNYTNTTTWNSANAPTLTLADGAVIQNNVSTSNAGGIHAFCSTLYIAGGSILNCGAGGPNSTYSLSGNSSGTAMNIQGSHFFFSSGTVSGNYGGANSYTAIALGATSYDSCIMSGGTIQNNVSTSGGACGAIMLDDGNSRFSNLWLTGGTIRNNVGNITGGIGVWSVNDLLYIGTGAQIKVSDNYTGADGVKSVLTNVFLKSSMMRVTGTPAPGSSIGFYTATAPSGSADVEFAIAAGATAQQVKATAPCFMSDNAAAAGVLYDDGARCYFGSSSIQIASHHTLAANTLWLSVEAAGVNITNDFRNVSLSNTAAANNRDYSTVITPLSGYQMPGSFTVTVNSTIYTVNTATGAVTVNGSAGSGISYAAGTKQLSIAASMIKSGTTIRISGEATLIPTLTATALSGSSSEYDTAAPKSFSIADHDFPTAPTSYTAQWCDASGNTSGASSAGTLSVGAVTNGDAVLTLTPSAAANADTYYFKVASGSISVTKDFTITKTTATADMTTAAVLVPNHGKTGATATLPALPAGGSYGTPSAGGTIHMTGMSISGTTLTFTAPVSTAGQTGTVTIPVTGAKNYNNYNIVVTVTSGRTAVTLSGLTAPANRVYNGTAMENTAFGSVAVSSVAVSVGSLQYAYYLADGTTQTTLANSGAAANGAAPKNAGNYTLVVSVPESNDEYEGSSTLPFTIQRRPVTITGLSAADKIYDRTAIASVVGAAAVSNAVSGDDVAVDVGTAAFAGVNATNGIMVTFGGYTLKGLSKDNYVLTAQPAGVTASILPKDITVSGITAADKVYDGGVDAAVNTVSAQFLGLVVGDTLGVTASGTFADKNTGTGKTVQITGLALTGNELGNYKLAITGQQETSSASITAAGLTLTADAKCKAYGQADPALTYTASGWVSGDSGSLLLGALTRPAGEDAGDYAIEQSTLSAGGNYAIIYAGANLTINKADISLGVTVDPASAKPGKTVVLTVNAVNGAVNLTDSGWNQPGGVTLTAPDGTPLVLTPAAGTPGQYTASYTIPAHTAADTQLLFTASAADETGNYNTPDPQTATLTVTPMSAVTLTLTADKTEGVTYGDSVTYTAAVEKADPAQDMLYKLDGTVCFYLGDAATGTLLAARTIGPDALCVTLDRADLTKGDHTVTAVYSGNGEFAAAEKSVTIVVAAKPLAWDTSALSSVKVFDGTAAAPFTGDLALSGAVGTDDLGFTYDKAATAAAYTDANAGTDKTATVTVADAAVTNGNYILPSEAPTFTGTITPVREIPAPAEPEPNGYQFKLEMQTEIVSVPDAIVTADPTLNTPAAVQSKLNTTISGILGSSDTAIADFDLLLWVSKDEGATWEKATAENFPAAGITVTIPYAELGITYEQAQHMVFTVTHMFSSAVNGHTPGSVETPAWTVTADGLRFTVAGLSPIAVGYQALPLVTYDANGGTSQTVSDYTALSGRLSSLPLPARSGYTFDGWYTAPDGGAAVSTDTVFTGDLTVYAHWSPIDTNSGTAGGGVNTGDGSFTAFWVAHQFSGHRCSLPPQARGQAFLNRSLYFSFAFLS